MKSRLLAVSLCGLLTAPALVHAQQTSGAASGSVGTTDQSAQKKADRISVASARTIVGDRVQDRNGKDLGTVDYLLIGVDDARVRYAVVAPQDGGNDQLVPVPWTALDTHKTGDNVLITDRETFSKQKKYREDQISELTQPSVITQIYEVWAPVAQKGQQQTQSQSGGQQVGKQTSGKQEPSGAQQGEGNRPHFLVGRDTVVTIMPPVFRTSNDLRGSDVYSSDDKEYGSIDNLMIDLDHGRLTYVQVGHGGFLGLGEEITPIPYGALSYDHERNAYRVNKSESDLEKVQHFARGEQPRSVKMSDLSKLYKDFGVQPYWQEKT